MATQQSNAFDVIVVGAGISGLRAASELKDIYHMNVKVLEARNKIGGRVQQDDTFLPGRKVELGAEFIHGDINPIVQLCEENGWGRRQIFTWSHGDGGPAEGPAPDGGIGYYYIGKEKKLLAYDDSDPDMKICNEALWHLQDVPAEEAEKDKRTLRQYLVDYGVPERMIGLACAGYGNTAGGTADTVPASRAMRYERAWHGDGSELDPDFRMEHSFSLLIDHLAKGLNITANSPVQLIRVDTNILKENMAAVEASRADPSVQPPVRAPRYACSVVTVSGEVYHAHRVVVTVPLPVLRDGDITFEPPLSAAKVAAAKSMSFANGVKIALKFHRRAWPAKCHGVVCADSFIPEMWMNSSKGVGGLITGQTCTWSAPADEDTASNPSGVDAAHAHTSAASEAAESDVGSLASSAAVPSVPSAAHSSGGGSTPTAAADAEEEDEPGTVYTVTGFLMGVRADTILKEHSQAVIIARMLSQIDAMFGRNAAGAFVSGFVHNWAGEPYIRGAYSTPTMVEANDGARKLAENHLGCVFFAGEATAGTIDGRLRNMPAYREHYASPIVLHGAMNTGSIASCDVARSLGFNVTCTAEDHEHWTPTYINPADHSVSTRPPGSPSPHVHPPHPPVTKLEELSLAGGVAPAATATGRSIVPCYAFKKKHSVHRSSPLAQAASAPASKAAEAPAAPVTC